VAQKCQGEPEEWLIAITDRQAAKLADGSPAPGGAPDDQLWWPVAYREESEIRMEAE